MTLGEYIYVLTAIQTKYGSDLKVLVADWYEGWGDPNEDFAEHITIIDGECIIGETTYEHQQRIEHRAGSFR